MPVTGGTPGMRGIPPLPAGILRGAGPSTTATPPRPGEARFIP